MSRIEGVETVDETVKAALVSIERADDWADDLACDSHATPEMQIVAGLGCVCARLDAVIALQLAASASIRFPLETEVVDGE
jgi:hypothetical protein